MGVGLRYRQGYFHQRLDVSGWQCETYADTEFGTLPVGLALNADTTPITVTVSIRGRRVTAQVWLAAIGRVPLILLDTARDDNDPADRWITGHLYGGGRDTRLAQEMMLGIGGVRALRALGLTPAVMHLNEGHSAFLTLELVREQVAAGKPYREAATAARDRCVFTTHTPVAAGHDAFAPAQMDAFFTGYWTELGITHEEFLALVKRESSLSSVPVILITSTDKPSKEKILRVKMAGAQAFLVRPLSPEDVLRAVESAVSERSSYDKQ